MDLLDLNSSNCNNCVFLFFFSCCWLGSQHHHRALPILLRFHQRFIKSSKISSHFYWWHEKKIKQEGWTCQELKKSIYFNQPPPALLAELMHSTISQLSHHFASSAFIFLPWKLSFAGPVMYSKLHLQLTDKSTLCCAWRMAVKMKIHHAVLLCQEEGHFRFPGSSAQGEAIMTVLSQNPVVNLFFLIRF